MLRHRPHRRGRGVVLHPAAGWLALSVLYLAAVVLNVLLAASTEEFWPLALAVVLGAGALACAAVAGRNLHR
ncbi:hypothetical protein [Actinophytocola gossypii]|uniref:DUF4175 domain-containing protein n=1 Tax=Actinophytocola gossypii TaxID=2812003 RepID=A0ABT2JEB8_9PSEU|nr:hypothetical protein [Actinophytocola gossypii]MCT2586098.1 hypothetical protein [Actinophytocola gossypii]